MKYYYRLKFENKEIAEQVYNQFSEDVQNDAVIVIVPANCEIDPETNEVISQEEGYFADVISSKRQKALNPYVVNPYPSTPNHTVAGWENFHKTLLETPDHEWGVVEIRQWLDCRGVDYAINNTEVTLLEKVREHLKK